VLTSSLSKVREHVYECKQCRYRADRHLVACINLLKMWGTSSSSKALDELVEREELRTSIKDYIAQNPCSSLLSLSLATSRFLTTSCVSAVMLSLVPENVKADGRHK
jgi:transposase